MNLFSKTGLANKPLHHYTLVIILISLWSQCANSSADIPTDNRKLLFQTGFEGSTAIVKKNSILSQFVGGGSDRPESGNWDQLMRITSGRLQGGTVSYSPAKQESREATITLGPVSNKNNVVRLWGGVEPDSRKFRIQANLFSPIGEGLKEFSTSVRLYIPQEMSALKDFPKEINWLTVAEFWNDPAWTSNEENEHAFRLTVGIGKNKGEGEDLYFRISTDDMTYTGSGKNRKYKISPVKIIKATNFPLPTGKWMTIEYYLKDGNEYDEKNPEASGHFTMAITPDGGKRHIISSIPLRMHNLTNPAPKGFSYWSPMKMYTSIHVANWMEIHGKGLELFYDDLMVWEYN